MKKGDRRTLRTRVERVGEEGGVFTLTPLLEGVTCLKEYLSVLD